MLPPAPRLLALSLLALGLAAPAGALTIDPTPVPFSGGGVSGSIELLGVVQGAPASSVVLHGSVAPTDTTLVFRGHLDPGSQGGFPFVFATAVVSDPTATSGTPFTGLGAAAGTGEAVNDALADASFPGAGIFLTSVQPGESTQPFFVSYAQAPAPGEVLLAGGGTLSQLATGHGTLVAAGAAPVPEPTALTAALLGLGLVAWRLRALG